jgi:hypothetical protein
MRWSGRKSTKRAEAPKSKKPRRIREETHSFKDNSVIADLVECNEEEVEVLKGSTALEWRAEQSCQRVSKAVDNVREYELVLALSANSSKLKLTTASVEHSEATDHVNVWF